MSNSNENEIANYSSYVQHGDYDAIKDLLRRKNNLNVKQNVVSANHIDSDGCSLVQWAAVNNRFSIMNLLIDNDADLLYSGGLLGVSNTEHVTYTFIFRYLYQSFIIFN